MVKIGDIVDVYFPSVVPIYNAKLKELPKKRGLWCVENKNGEFTFQTYSFMRRVFDKQGN